LPFKPVGEFIHTEAPSIKQAGVVFVGTGMIMAIPIGILHVNRD